MADAAASRGGSRGCPPTSRDLPPCVTRRAPKGESMMRSHQKWTSTLAVGLLAVSLPVGLAWANHVRVEGTSDQGVIYAPPGTAVVVPTPPPPGAVTTTVKADGITAQQVRANTIYANKIEADEVRGTVYQNRDLKIGDTKGDIRAPEVVASVIYADEIKANSVQAETIYVRDLKRR